MKFLAYLFCYLVYPFSFLFPRSRKKMAFGSFRGSFNDNARYLFIHAAEHSDGKIKTAWISKNRNTVKKVRSYGLKAYWILNPAGIWYALTSKYWIFNSYTSDIMFCLSGGAVCINLWHGVGLKRIEFNTQSGPLADRFSKKNRLDAFYHPESFRRPNWLLTSTPFQTSMFAKAFRIPETRCLELGYPRNWILTTGNEERRRFIDKFETAQTSQFIDRLAAYDKVFVYMPTWRDSQRTIFTQSMDLERLNRIMADRNSLLILKPHANVLLSDNLDSLSNVILFDSKMDIYPVLPYTHVLITDYSSILYDWILMEHKDVILYLYDYESYVKERDFYYPFDENVAGAKVYDFESLCSCLESGNYALPSTERNRLVEKFWGKTTGFDSSEMILDFIIKNRPGL